MHVREQQKKLSALERELVAAKQEGFTSNHWSKTNKIPKKRPLVVIGVLTTFGRKNNRDAIRKAWMGTGKVPPLYVRLLFYFFSLDRVMFFCESVLNVLPSYFSNTGLRINY